VSGCLSATPPDADGQSELIWVALTSLDSRALAALRKKAASPGLRVLVLAGADADFCTGLVLAAADATTDAAEGVRQLAGLLQELDRAKYVVVAAVRGRALGGGVGLAAVADVVIAEPSASFGLPEALVGLLPAVVFPYVARRVGPARARAMALTTRSIDAAEALRVGLVDDVAPNVELAVKKLAKRILMSDRAAVAALKSLVAETYGVTAEADERAFEYFDARMSSPATRARIGRFREGLSPWGSETSDPQDGTGSQS
jgi:polyketide biosynthesis enoyl-CoA hydratase PksH